MRGGRRLSRFTYFLVGSVIALIDAVVARYWGRRFSSFFQRHLIRRSGRRCRVHIMRSFTLSPHFLLHHPLPSRFLFEMVKGLQGLVYHFFMIPLVCFILL